MTACLLNFVVIIHLFSVVYLSVIGQKYSLRDSGYRSGDLKSMDYFLINLHDLITGHTSGFAILIMLDIKDLISKVTG